MDTDICTVSLPPQTVLLFASVTCLDKINVGGTGTLTHAQRVQLGCVNLDSGIRAIPLPSRINTLHARSCISSQTVVGLTLILAVRPSVQLC